MIVAPSEVADGLAAHKSGLCICPWHLRALGCTTFGVVHSIEVTEFFWLHLIRLRAFPRERTKPIFVQQTESARPAGMHEADIRAASRTRHAHVNARARYPCNALRAPSFSHAPFARAHPIVLHKKWIFCPQERITACIPALPAGMSLSRIHN